MFALRTAVFGVLGRGMRSGPGLLSAGRQVAKTCWGEKRPPAAGTSVLGVSRTYGTVPSAGKPSQLDDLSPTMFKKEYIGINADEVNDVVKRILSLDMASQSDKLKIKIQQLVEKVRRSPDDCTSTEVHIATITARIQNFKEHVETHPKDKANKRQMLMLIDRRKKILKFLRRTHYNAFEHVCTQLGIEYTFPPEYYRPATKRWIAKKAFCLEVYKATQLKKRELLLKKRFPKANAPLYVFPQPTN